MVKFLTILKNLLLEVGEASLAPYPYKLFDNNEGWFTFTTENKTIYYVDLTLNHLDSKTSLEVEFQANPTGDNGEYTYARTDVVSNKGELYKVMATITSIIKDYVAKYNVDYLVYEPLKSKENETSLNNQRNKLYKAFILKNHPQATFTQTRKGKIIVNLN